MKTIKAMSVVNLKTKYRSIINLIIITNDFALEDAMGHIDTRFTRNRILELRIKKWISEDEIVNVFSMDTPYYCLEYVFINVSVIGSSSLFQTLLNSNELKESNITAFIIYPFQRTINYKVKDMKELIAFLKTRTNYIEILVLNTTGKKITEEYMRSQYPEITTKILKTTYWPDDDLAMNKLNMLEHMHEVIVSKIVELSKGNDLNEDPDEEEKLNQLGNLINMLVNCILEIVEIIRKVFRGIVSKIVGFTKSFEEGDQKDLNKKDKENV